MPKIDLKSGNFTKIGRSADFVYMLEHILILGT